MSDSRQKGLSRAYGTSECVQGEQANMQVEMERVHSFEPGAKGRNVSLAGK